jgi:hypothetical protein
MGGGGADRFEFTSTTDSGPAPALRDRIIGFHQGLDLFDLSAIDADTATDGNQGFAFIGAASFSAAGQVRAQRSGGHTLVELSNDADTAPELSFAIAGRLALTAADFLL